MACGQCGKRRAGNVDISITPVDPNAPKPPVPTPIGEVQPSKLTKGLIITKRACPKCNYWMGLSIKPSTKERTYICQNSLCKHTLPA